ncbi:MAG: hypothetical protein K2I83_05365, partial [Bacteroidales bacterium]|nr:hypothetical protein [Bacteroidales bacterium]
HVLVKSQTIPTQYFVKVSRAEGCPSYDTVEVGMITPDSLWAKVKQKSDTCTPAVIEHPAWRMSGSMIPMVDGQVVRSGSQPTGWTNLISTTPIDGDFKLRYVITGQEVPGMVGVNYVGHTYPNGFDTWQQYAASYSFYISWHNGGHDLEIYENGSCRYANTENWQTGDILFIVRERGYIYYYHNEHLVRKVRDVAPNTAMCPQVSLYRPATAFARIDFARLPNISISATAGDLPKLDHEWYVNGKLVSTSANPKMGDFDLVNGDTLVYRVWGNTNCDGRISASDTMIEIVPAGYEPIFVELTSDEAQCEYGDIMVRARIIGLPDEIDPSQIRYSWHSGTMPYGPAGITADSMLFTNISTTQYVWVEAYIEPEPGQCVFNGKNAPVRSRNLFLPVIPQRILGVNIDVYPGTKVCQFEEVRFNATQVVSGLQDAGENPVTDWYHNGKWVYQGKTYVPDTALHDGDSIFAIITASPELVCLDTNRKATKTLHMEVIDAPVLKAHNDTLVPYGTSVPLWAEVIDHWEPNLKYEWYPNFDIETPGFTPYDSATRAVPRIDHYYVVEALNEAGCLSNKAQVHVEVLTCPQFIIRGNTNTACVGDTALIYLMVQGFRPYTNQYIWQMSNNGGTSWSNIKIDTVNYFQIVGERSITLGIPKTQLMHDASRAVFRCLAIATDPRLDCDTITSMNLYLNLIDFKVPNPKIDIPKPL